MERLNQEQIANLQVKVQGTRNWEDSVAANIYKEINLLHVEEGILVKNEEWPLKQRPANSSMPNALRTMGRKYSVMALADDSGFVLTRIA